MRMWILVAAIIVAYAINPNQIVNLGMVIMIVLSVITGLIMDIIEFKDRNKPLDEK
jgi:hypothetical protein